MAEFLWRAMTEADLPAVQQIADSVHLDFYERPEVLAERLVLAPFGCRLLERDSRPLGYLLSHPWRAGDLPPLDTLIGTLPENADTWYLHDLCLLPGARGTGAASELVRAMIADVRALGFPGLSLVAVNGSQPFWTRMGFSVENRPALAAKLLSYEPEARYMSLTLPKDPR